MLVKRIKSKTRTGKTTELKTIAETGLSLGLKVCIIVQNNRLFDCYKDIPIHSGTLTESTYQEMIEKRKIREYEFDIILLDNIERMPTDDGDPVTLVENLVKEPFLYKPALIQGFYTVSEEPKSEEKQTIPKFYDGEFTIQLDGLSSAYLLAIGEVVTSADNKTTEKEKEKPTIKTVDEWASEWIDEHINPKLNDIEFTSIKDELSFMELVDKFKDTHSLRGGQKADGNWWLTGVVKQDDTE